MKWTLSLIILTFLVPILGAAALFHYADKIPIKTSYTGVLYQPPHAPHTLSFTNEAYLGKWQVAYIQPQPCNTHCKSDIQMLNNLHTAVGKEQHKMITRILEPTQLSHSLSATEGAVLLLDPKGWLVMQYPSIQNTKGILKDLQRLLRLSHDR